MMDIHFIKYSNTRYVIKISRSSKVSHIYLQFKYIFDVVIYIIYHLIFEFVYRKFVFSQYR